MQSNLKKSASGNARDSGEIDRSISQSVHPFLQTERNKCSFDKEYLTQLVDGGEYITKIRRNMEKLVESQDEVKNAPKFHFMTREQAYADAVRKTALFLRLREPGTSTYSVEPYYMGKSIFPNELNLLTLHQTMVVPLIELQGTEEQKKEWIPKLLNLQIISTYVQTELGHGSFIRGLETTATYDVTSQHFIFNSPTLTSTKWWPGGSWRKNPPSRGAGCALQQECRRGSKPLGKTVDHAIVMARLMIKGSDKGVHSFIVQLRNAETHQVLPGLTIGDIGPKFGFESVDNGFMRFDNCKVPRKNMLSKYSQVHPDGTYTTSHNNKSKKLSYSSMVFVRSMLVYEGSATWLAQAATIAVRYSCIRQQSEYEPNKPEPQIIVYRSQQYQLFCQLSAAYCFFIAGHKLRQLYFNVKYDMTRGDLEALPELHATSAGLKALTLEEALEGVSVCRAACGGHGYSASSNFPKLYTQTAAACTYEGIHPVLYLQTARYLVKVFKLNHVTNSSDSTISYIKRKSELAPKFACPFFPRDLLSMFELRSIMCISKASRKLDGWLDGGRAYHEAWNLASLELIKASKAHSQVFLISAFHDKIEEVQKEKECVSEVLGALFELYTLKSLLGEAADFIEACGLTFDQLDACRSRVEDLLVQIRPQAVPLVDAFEFTDHILDSCLGRYDGRVYEALYDWAKKSPLNQSEVHPSIKLLKPKVKSNL